MHAAKRKRLEAAGWRIGSAEEFLGLTKGETALVEMKLALARWLDKKFATVRAHRGAGVGRVS